MRWHHKHWNSIGVKLCLSCVTIFVLLLSSCSSLENVRIIQQTAPYSDGELTITATFLDDRTLIGRYGFANPFLAPIRLLTPVEFLVIELSIDGPEDFEFIRSRHIQLTFNSLEKKPVSVHRLLAIWENAIDSHGVDVVNSDYRRMVRAYLIPNDVTTKTTALLIFQGQFPLAGNAIISIPHFAPDKSTITDLKSKDESKLNPIEPVFDGEFIHFNFVIENEERERNLFSLF